MTEVVPTAQPSTVIVTPDGQMTLVHVIYLQTLEAALRDALARIEVLEAFHP